MEINFELSSPLIPIFLLSELHVGSSLFITSLFLRLVLTYMPQRAFNFAKDMLMSYMTHNIVIIRLLCNIIARFCQFITFYPCKCDMIKMLLLSLHRLFTKYSM